MTGYREEGGVVVLTMTDDEYDRLVIAMMAGFVKAVEMDHRQAAVEVVETLARITEGDPGIGERWPDMKKQIALLREKWAKKSSAAEAKVVVN